ncbi:MAG: hypothetical protein ABIO96_07075 [Nitrospiraceae bacterium]
MLEADRVQEVLARLARGEGVDRKTVKRWRRLWVRAYLHAQLSAQLDGHERAFRYF